MPSLTRRSEVADRADDVQRCEQTLADAEDALSAARHQLDQALYARGWPRLHGGFGPEVRLYQRVGGNPVALPEVLKACLAEDQRQ